MRILTLIWLAGVIIFVLYQTACYLSFSGIVRRWARNVTDERILTAAKSAKEFAGVKRDICVKTCKAASTPMVFGIIRPVLLLPCDNFTDSELAIILRHELVHMRRHDLWYKLLVMAARAVHWFNPLVHIMARAADADMELACDAEVVKNENAAYRRGYCETIMRLVHNGQGRGTAISTCFLFSKKKIMERFYGILDEKIKRNGVVMFCVIAVSVAASGGAITFATDNVAEVIEDDLGIVEHPAPETASAAAEHTPDPTAEEPSGADYTDGGYSDTDYTYDDYPDTDSGEDYNPESDSTYIGADYDIDSDYSYDSGYNEYSAPGETAAENGGNLGEPESVSHDGSRETYTLDNGSTAIV